LGLSLDKIKKDIANANIASKVTSVMSSISRNRINKLKDKLQLSKFTYQLAINSLSELISYSSNLAKIEFIEINKHIHNLQHKYNNLASFLAKIINNVLINNKPKKCIFVLFGSDKGLCGSLNSASLLEFSKIYNKYDNQSSIITIGNKQKKAVEKLKTDCKIINVPLNRLNHNSIVDTVQKIINSIELIQNNFDEIIIIYHKSTSLHSCKPCSISLYDIIDESSQQNYYNSNDLIDLNIDKDNNGLANLYQIIFSTIIENCLINNHISENILRMISMNSANSNAKEIKAEKQILYAKKRQEKITNELLEMIKN
jgi:F-type H+-transporting ATPase subunit gamma